MMNIKEIIGDLILNNFGYPIADIIEVNIKHKVQRDLVRIVDEGIRIIIDNNIDMLIRDILKNNQLKH